MKRVAAAVGAICFWLLLCLTSSSGCDSRSPDTGRGGNPVPLPARPRPKEVLKTGMVYAMVFHPKGHLIAVLDANHISAWEPDTNKMIYRVSAASHTFLRCLAISADGAKLASGENKGVIRVWETETGKELASWETGGDAVYCAAFTPNGEVLATGTGSQGAIQLWSVATQKAVGYLWGHKEAVHALAIDKAGERLISGSDDATVRVWDLGRRKELATFRGHSGFVAAVCLCDGERRVVSGGLRRDRSGRGIGGEVHVWDLQNQAEVAHFDRHSARVIAAVPAPAEGYVATAGEDGVVYVWATENGKEVATLPVHDGNDGLLTSLALDPKTRLLASGGWDRAVKFWEWPRLQ